MDLNLDTLKQEILEYLEHSEFAVFRTAPGTLEGLPTVLWDAERYPDYQMFLDTARKTGAKMVLFSARELEAPEIDDSVEQLAECDFTPAERSSLLAELRSSDVQGAQLFEAYLDRAFPGWNTGGEDSGPRAGASRQRRSSDAHCIPSWGSSRQPRRPSAWTLHFPSPGGRR